MKTTVVCPAYINTGMFDGVQVILFPPFLGAGTFLTKIILSLFQSKIIQILDPQFVADQVVDATLSDKPILMLPWWTSYLIMLKVAIRFRLLNC